MPAALRRLSEGIPVRSARHREQGLVWKLALNGIILNTRPRRKARDYLKIWNTEKNESPLKTITRAQSDKFAAAIADHDHVIVDWAMRYGNPSIRSRIMR